jgi:hypothetical protein
VAAHLRAAARADLLVSMIGDADPLLATFDFVVSV